MSGIEQTSLDFGGLYKFLLYYHRFQILDSLNPKSMICVVAECADNDFRNAGRSAPRSFRRNAFAPTTPALRATARKASRPRFEKTPDEETAYRAKIRTAEYRLTEKSVSPSS